MDYFLQVGTILLIKHNYTANHILLAFIGSYFRQEKHEVCALNDSLHRFSYIGFI